MGRSVTNLWLQACLILDMGQGVWSQFADLWKHAKFSWVFHLGLSQILDSHSIRWFQASDFWHLEIAITLDSSPTTFEVDRSDLAAAPCLVAGGSSQIFDLFQGVNYYHTLSFTMTKILENSHDFPMTSHFPWFLAQMLGGPSRWCFGAQRLWDHLGTGLGPGVWAGWFI